MASRPVASPAMPPADGVAILQGMESTDHPAAPTESPGDIDVIASSALLLLGDGSTVAELSARLSALASTIQEAGAEAALDRLASLGLVRVASARGDTRRYVRTTLGQEYARSHPGADPQLAGHLTELERLRTEFVATIAHELRTPLTAMRTCIGLLMDANAEPAPDVRERLLNMVASSAESMQRLIADLLDLARYRSGNIELQSWWLDATELAEGAVALVTPLLNARGQSVRLRRSARPLLVFGDRRRLEQALLNLLSNAHRYSPEGAAIDVSVRRDGMEAVWEVRDRGPGISPADQAHVFERFFRGGRDTARGAGLGLSIALAIAQAHDGTITLDSRLGEGSTFALRVPLGDPTGSELA